MLHSPVQKAQGQEMYETRKKMALFQGPKDEVCK